MTFYALSAKKTKSAFQKMYFRSRSDRLFCLFRPVQIKCHLILKIYTSVKNLYTYAPNFFQIFFLMFYYFLNFAKKKDAGEPGSRKSALMYHWRTFNLFAIDFLTFSPTRPASFLLFIIALSSPLHSLLLLLH